MTPTKFIDAINLHLRSGRTVSHEALTLVTRAIRAFPDCAELWLLHGWVTMAAKDGDVVDSAARSFEMAVLLDPAMQEAHVALASYHQTRRDAAAAVKKESARRRSKIILAAHRSAESHTRESVHPN